MKKHLIYGATSLISINLIKLLIQEDQTNNFFLICRNKKKLEFLLEKFEINKKNIIEIYEVDILDIELNLKVIRENLHNIDFVYFLIGVTGNPESEIQNIELLKNNFEINLINPVIILTKLLIKISNNGGICVVTSLAGLRGRKIRLHYCSAKAGLINYLSGLNQYLSKRNITVTNCIAGYMSTETFDLKAPGILITNPQNVAKKIIKAMKSKKHIFYTSFLWRIIGIIIRIIPNKIFKNLKF